MCLTSIISTLSSDTLFHCVWILLVFLAVLTMSIVVIYFVMLNVSDGDSDVLNSFQRDTTFNSCRYVVKQSSTTDHESIPDNFDVCRSRLKSLKRDLMRKRWLLVMGIFFRIMRRLR